MSKKSKTASRERRKHAKRSRKEANRARYAAMRDAGQNRKKKSGDESGRATIRLKRHANGACGNIGCVRCSEVAQRLKARRE
jgi:hypothetical protein